MKKIILAAAAVAAFPVLAAAPVPPAGAEGPSLNDLKADPTNTQEVLTYGMGWGQQRYSPLKQINLSNVKNLVPVWSYSLADKRAQSTQPLVKDGVMYITNHNSTVAVDAVTGHQIWKQTFDYDPAVPGIVCCGNHNRGPAIYNGRLYRTTLDAHVIALDLKTGEEIWRSKAADYKDGYSMTVAPLIAKGVVITGISGAEYGTRGFLDGWDAKSGKHLWRKHTTAAPDEEGGDTWLPGRYERGGASTWLTGSYDPELDLVYWGTGNGGPWNAAFRGGDSKHIASVLAFRPKTGDVVWTYQFSPGDPYDYDGTSEMVHATLKVDGKKRDVIMQANRNGFMYVLDRQSGELLKANPFVDKITWAKGIDLKTGRPIDTEITKTVRKSVEMDKPVDIWPSAWGGKNWSPMSYDPESKLVYANTLNFGFPYRPIQPKYRAGTFYIGMEWAGFSWPENNERGILRAIDPLTGKAKWSTPFEIPNFAGTMNTAGDLLFTGALTGEFMAFNKKNGKKVWEHKTGSGIVSMPITYDVDGIQYVTIVSGVGGVYPLYSGDERMTNVPAGGSVTTYALFDKSYANR
ncbi:MAG: PQQ-dependent dehydrogenase, methanol/ethanol family [Neptuniibacter sp.]